MASSSDSSSSPAFLDELHVSYVLSLSSKLFGGVGGNNVHGHGHSHEEEDPDPDPLSSVSYEGAVTSHMTMAGVYWGVTAVSLLRPAEEVERLMNLTNLVENFVLKCYDPSVGGFGGQIGHDPHILYTLYALLVLAVADRLEDVEKDAIVGFVTSLQPPPPPKNGNHDHDYSHGYGHGRVYGDRVGGEVDARFVYCAVSILSLLGALEDSHVHVHDDNDNDNGNHKVDDNNNQRKGFDVDAAARYIASHQNHDGGFGAVPGAESHASYAFTCVAALSMVGKLSLLDDDGYDGNKDNFHGNGLDRLAWWLAERQCDSGGLNGRPEKQADVCYSWWILSTLSILGRVDWIAPAKLEQFILLCQDPEDGGIADRPEDMPDVFHTFFGICGLSLLGKLHHGDNDNDNDNDNDHANTNAKHPLPPPPTQRHYRKIDPIYALPTDVVDRLKLRGQVVAGEGEEVDPRLQRYDVLRRGTK